MDIYSARGIIETIRYVSVSTVDSDGKPWSAPVWYVYDENGIYWWSSIHSKHQQNLTRDDRAYLTIFDSTKPEGDGSGLYIDAHVTQVPDEFVDNVIELYNQSTHTFKLNHSNTSGDAPTRVYHAQPEQVWFNDGKEEDGYWSDFRSMLGRWSEIVS